MTTTAEAPVLCNTHNGIATLTLNRPAKLNALSIGMIAVLLDTLRSLHQPPGLRAVILTGAGSKAFCGGAQVEALASLGPTTSRAFITSLHDICEAIRRLPVPVIARIDGHCIGAGLEIAAACDLRLASTRAKFAMPEVRLGIPSVIETVLLPGLIGWGRTRLMVYTGRVIDAAAAYDWGLLEELVEPDALDAAVQRCVEEITASDAGVIASQKRLMREWEGMTPSEGIALSIDEFEQTWQRPEPRKRLSDFVAQMEARRVGKK